MMGDLAQAANITPVPGAPDANADTPGFRNQGTVGGIAPVTIQHMCLVMCGMQYQRRLPQ